MKGLLESILVALFATEGRFATWALLGWVWRSWPRHALMQAFRPPEHAQHGDADEITIDVSPGEIGQVVLAKSQD